MTYGIISVWPDEDILIGTTTDPDVPYRPDDTHNTLYVELTEEEAKIDIDEMFIELVNEILARRPRLKVGLQIIMSPLTEFE